MTINKTILIISTLLVVAIAALFLINPTLSGLATSTPENTTPNVKIATFAVCEQKEGYNYCKDKIFASCNGTPIEVNNSEFYCLGKRYEVKNASLGETIQPENWTDTRDKNLITGWATSN